MDSVFIDKQDYDLAALSGYLPSILIFDSTYSLVYFSPKAKQELAKIPLDSKPNLTKIFSKMTLDSLNGKLEELGGNTETRIKWKSLCEKNGKSFDFELSRSQENSQNYLLSFSNCGNSQIESNNGMDVVRSSKMLDHIEYTKYRGIFDNTLDGIFLSGFENTSAVECNGSVAKMFEASEAELLDGGVLKFSPEFQPDGQKSSDKYQAIREEMLAKQGGNKFYDWVYQRKSGELFDAEVVVSLLELEDRKWWLTIVRDISDRKKSQRKLEQSVKKFKALFNNTFDVAFVLNSKGEIVEANDTSTEVLKIDLENDKGKVIWDCGFWNKTEIAGMQIQSFISEVNKSKELKRFSEIFEKENSREKLTFDFSLKPFSLDENEEVTLMILEGREVTELVEIKEEIVKNERLYRSIIRNTQGTSVLLFNRKHEVILVEGNYFEMFGKEKEDILGGTPINIIDDLKIAQELDRRFGEAIQGLLGIFEVSFRDVHYYVKTIPMRESDGEILQAMVIIQDVTDIKKVESQLRVNVEELNEKKLTLERYIDSNRELENFAYIVSHDLKEPLRNIMGFAQLLNKNYADKVDQIGKEYLDFIVNGGKRMDSLISSLLDYSRVNEGEYHFYEIKTKDVFNIMTSNLMKTIVESHAQINISHNVPATIVAEQQRICQLLQNLVANAIKFSSGIENQQPVINIDAVAKPNHWQFSVSDNGVGIPEEYFSSIFSLFKKVPNNKKYVGTGIGLAICKRIIEQHSGEIWVESELGKGSTFYFTIKKSLKPEN